MCTWRSKQGYQCLNSGYKFLVTKSHDPLSTHTPIDPFKEPFKEPFEEPFKVTKSHDPLSKDTTGFNKPCDLDPTGALIQRPYTLYPKQYLEDHGT